MIWLTHTCHLTSNDCMSGNCPECLQPGLLLSDLKTDIDLIFFVQWLWVEEKIVRVNQMMLFGHAITKWVETIIKLKRNIYIENVSKLPVIIKRTMSWRQEKHLCMLIIAKTRITLSNMKFRVHILFTKTLVFLLPVHITIKLNKVI